MAIYLVQPVTFIFSLQGAISSQVFNIDNIAQAQPESMCLTSVHPSKFVDIIKQTLNSATLSEPHISA